MSNYNLTLQSNNTDLQAILNTINELPEAGGEQATPVVSINPSTGLVTATAGAKTSTYQLAFQPAKTITPSTASQIAVSSGYYTGGDIVVEAVPTATQATPTITVNSSGLITASATQTAGYVVAGTKSATKQLTTQGAQTITPGTSNKTIASGRYLTGTQTIKGDANLVAGNIKSGISIFGVSGTLESGGSGEQVEWSANEDAIIGGIISSYFNDRVTNICDYAFGGCANLTTVSFPKCTSIGSAAFCSCYSLTTVSFPNCTTISYDAFYHCSKLTTASFPACISIGNGVFEDCSSLTTVSFPVCTSIGNNAFDSCSKLTTASFPNCSTIGTNAFTYCTSLTTVSFPTCTRISTNTFGGCANLTTVSFPKCTSINMYAFDGCANLTTVSFPKCTSISGYAFNRCFNLQSFYLTGSSLCKLSNSNAFQSTPYAGYSASFSGTPYIYVPASLVDSYKTATNWTYFSSYFSAYDPIIAFSIDGVEYQAEEGMTWGDWVNSNYNTDGYTIDEWYGYVVHPDGRLVGIIESTTPTDTIISGKSYITVS